MEDPPSGDMPSPRPMDYPDELTPITAAARTIYRGFHRYNENFHRITERARVRFENRDWKGHQQDIADRVELYEKSVRRIADTVRQILLDGVHEKENASDSETEEIDRLQWQAVRAYLGERLNNIPDSAFIKTFFNSITRRLFGTVGDDPDLEFVFSSFDEGTDRIAALNLRRYPYWGSLNLLFETVLADFAFKVSYSNTQREVENISSKIADFCEQHGCADELLRFEFIDSFFYQSARAYLVGRVIKKRGILPLVIAFKHDKDGVCSDAVLMSAEEVSIVFGYTRSYYFADPNSVEAAVHFLHSILPDKPVDELFTVLGRLRQGKTERYHRLRQHLDSTNDQFRHAQGEKGLVMLVFDLPSYDLVFKIIRDRFGFPKTIARRDVIDKYKLVSQHDRAGRLIDTQEFLNIQFPLARFSSELLADLQQHASKTVEIVGDQLLIKHAYVERRVRPLNLYIQEVSPEDAELAIIDYGQALKDLAQTNIFPGDLLLKNFGVTKHRRVVFYDYDEVALITECNFREIPQARDMHDEMRDVGWYHVSENDIFPEEHLKFLAMNSHLRDIFMKVHGELDKVEYWREIQRRHQSGHVSPVVPYLRPVAR